MVAKIGRLAEQRNRMAAMLPGLPVKYGSEAVNGDLTIGPFSGTSYLVIWTKYFVCTN
jgi:hypothetical protein